MKKRRTKVQEEESLTEAYGDIADASKSIDMEIDDVLSQPDRGKASKSLDEFKKKMGIN